MKKSKKSDIKQILGISIGFLTALFVSITALFNIFDNVELQTLDLRFKAFNDYRQKPDQNIVVIGIDEISVAKIGRWPWKREEHSKIVKFLDLYGAKAIIYDVFFSYEDEEHSSSDERFVEAVKNVGNVYMASRFLPVDDNEKYGTLLNKTQMIDNAVLDKIKKSPIPAKSLIPKNKELGFQPPFQKLSESVKKLGTVYVGDNEENKIRYQDLIYKDNEDIFSSLAVAFAVDYLKESVKIPVDEKDRAVINWTAIKVDGDDGFLPPYAQYSAWRFIKGYEQIERAANSCKVQPCKIKEILDNPDDNYEYFECFPDDFELDFDGHNPTDLFEGKFVFIGIASTSTTVRDQISTPFFKEIPGVYLHANVADNLLNNNFLKKVHTNITILLTFILSMFCSISIFRIRNSIYAVSFPIVVAAIYLAVSLIAFAEFDYWINIIYTESSIILTFAISMSVYYILEGREKLKIKRAMSNYIAPQVMEEVLGEPDKLKLGGDKKELSVLFSDIKGFTTISENNSPEDVVSMLNEYFDLMVHIILRNQGTFDKFIGDAIMAFWNAPLDIEDHAYLAVKTACEMQKTVEVLALKWKLDQDDFSIRIGINTDEVIVGNIGSDKIKDYTVIGDGVNVASRLEGLNKEYGTKIIISEHTYEIIRDRINAVYLGEVKLKGKNKFIKVYEVRSMK